ncbi:MOSC domain-containing protein [uncultured Amnibacterium sp.]|uniref:MOSC domain-containing protein n=1 Tax=uncultured Amnibacterium sp. TaxID=1631851 RepID=UPI0035CAACA1
MAGVVVAVALDDAHRFSKRVAPAVRLLAGLGVEGDAHAGVTVQHRSRVARDPSQPNLRQVHLIHRELLDEVDEAGFTVPPGAMGENITTEGVDLLGLPTGTRLRLGADAVVEVTGLRNPCLQIDGYEPGLLKRMVGRDADGNVVRLAGVMSVVLEGGEVRPGDRIDVLLPEGPRVPLAPV